MFELNADEWRHRYELEDALEHIYELEELYWHKRCGEQWLLEGDRNRVLSRGLLMGGKEMYYYLLDGW